MANHIYNDADGVVRSDRPNMFVNELSMYLKLLSEKIEEHKLSWGRASEKKLTNFADNLNNGIDYYFEMFNNVDNTFNDIKKSVLDSLDSAMHHMHNMQNDISDLIKKNH
jgi:hypothetical protein